MLERHIKNYAEKPLSKFQTLTKLECLIQNYALFTLQTCHADEGGIS